MALADAVARMSATDIPSFLSLHLDGRAPKTARFNIAPFGLDMMAFAVQSEQMMFTSPDLAIARTAMLDYFTAQRKRIPDDHIIFALEKSMSPGAEARLVEQMCWGKNVHTDKRQLTHGVYRDGIQCWIEPEFTAHRRAARAG